MTPPATSSLFPKIFHSLLGTVFPRLYRVPIVARVALTLFSWFLTVFFFTEAVVRSSRMVELRSNKGVIRARTSAIVLR